MKKASMEVGLKAWRSSWWRGLFRYILNLWASVDLDEHFVDYETSPDFPSAWRGGVNSSINPQKSLKNMQNFP